MKEWTNLQADIIKAQNKVNIDWNAYLIDTHDGNVYVSEHGYNLHIIPESEWMLATDDKTIQRMMGIGKAALHECVGEVSNNIAHYTGVSKEIGEGRNKRTALELINADGKVNYIDKKLTKYIPADWTTAYFDDTNKPVYFKSGDDVWALVLPIRS